METDNEYYVTDKDCWSVDHVHRGRQSAIWAAIKEATTVDDGVWFPRTVTIYRLTPAPSEPSDSFRAQLEALIESEFHVHARDCRELAREAAQQIAAKVDYDRVKLSDVAETVVVHSWLGGDR